MNWDGLVPALVSKRFDAKFGELYKEIRSIQ